MNAMKFIKIYAASVRDTMRQARRRPARREVLTASLGRKILSVPVSKRNFERSNFKRRNSKRQISGAQILKADLEVARRGYTTLRARKI
nr:hypothetical protein [uncultured Campylobacter sp.]